MFADPSGRRWRHIRVAFAALAVLLLATLAAFIPGAMRSPHTPAPAGRELSIADTGRQTPVVGTGPLERVVRVEGSPTGAVGYDPFTGERLAEFDAEQARAIGDHRYAIQQYGYSQTAHRTISLTFDDGPDPVATRQLLDLLAKEKVPSTFFVIGRNAVAHPELVQRMAREGHTVGVHTMTHPQIAEMPEWRQQAELVFTERLIRALTGQGTFLWRMPYTGPDVALQRETISGLLHAQRQGYVHADYDFDTLDWEHDAKSGGRPEDIPMPDFGTGENITVLLHDGGGPNRAMSVEYVRRLITQARAHGYTFHSMPQVAPTIAGANAPVAVTDYDRGVAAFATVFFFWPKYLMAGLFLLAVAIVLVLGVFNLALAIGRKRRRAAIVWPAADRIGVRTSVLVAAYNEAEVIQRTVRSILASDYPIAEVIVVDDGSKDATAEMVRRVALEDPRVVLIQQPNGGKSTALNRAVAEATGDVLVTLDADTILERDTVTNLVRHFAMPDADRLGAVAGIVAVGNRTKNLMTRWQALEYLTQIGLERASQDALGAISIVPGACAAWRRQAIVEAGGYSSVTLAEDCDLALTLHGLGWKVRQDDEAYAYTEVPEDLDSLLKQRERWTYGTLQSMWKHRSKMFNPRFGALGWYVLPNYLLSIAVPLVFLPFTALITVQTAQDGGLGLLATYWLLFCGIHFAMAAASIALMREDWRHLLMVPVYRLINDPLRAYLLYTSVLLAIRGGTMGWNKLQRTGSMDASHDIVPESTRLTKVIA